MKHRLAASTLGVGIARHPVAVVIFRGGNPRLFPGVVRGAQRTAPRAVIAEHSVAVTASVVVTRVWLPRRGARRSADSTYVRSSWSAPRTALTCGHRGASCRRCRPLGR